MTSLTDRLTESTEKETAIAIKNSPFESLARQGYRLYFGEKFGRHSIQYWLHPTSTKYSVDYPQALEIVENLLVPLELLKRRPYSSLSPAYQKRISSNFAKIIMHIGEILEMYRTGLADIEGKTLDIPNSQIAEGFKRIKSGVQYLQRAKNKPKFEEKASRFISFYRLVLFGKYFTSKR